MLGDRRGAGAPEPLSNGALFTYTASDKRCPVRLDLCEDMLVMTRYHTPSPGEYVRTWSFGSANDALEVLESVMVTYADEQSRIYLTPIAYGTPEEAREITLTPLGSHRLSSDALSVRLPLAGAYQQMLDVLHRLRVPGLASTCPL